MREANKIYIHENSHFRGGQSTDRLKNSKPC